MNRRDKEFLSRIEPQERAIASKYKDDPARAREKLMELHRGYNYEPQKIKARESMRRVAWTAVGLAAWYYLNPAPQQTASIESRYPLPNQIVVTESSVPYTVDQNGNKIVQVKDIDFSAPRIDIRTDKYHFVKDEDWKPVRMIGQVFSAIPKLYFWDHNIGHGADGDRTRALLAMAEGDTDIKDGITIRVNKSSPLTDLNRLFNEPELVERNNLLARSTIGVIDVFVGGLKSKLFRGDCYNPFTRTAVVYSNVESIGAHEMGHDEDFRRFDRDWAYSMSRALPPVMLYQEWRASQNAKGIMSNSDGWQFERYLLPAFFTYMVMGYEISKKMLKGMAERHRKVMEELRK